MSANTSRRVIRLTHRGEYVALRMLAFCCAVGFPGAAALEVFGYGGNQIVITIPEGIGMGAFIFICAIVIIFRQQVIGSLKKRMGMPGFVLPAFLFVLLLGLERLRDIIPQFRVVAFWWMVGGGVAWILSAFAAMFGSGPLFTVIDKEVSCDADAAD